MADLITRQAAIDVLDRNCILGQGLLNDTLDHIADVIMALPSAQPEIVRCKDCRYYQDNNGGYPHMNCKWDANETPDEDDFCSGAERRTDDCV